MERDILKKAAAFFARNQAVFAWIDAEKAEFPITKLCQYLQVSPSGFYAACGRPESARTQTDRRLRVLVRASFDESHPEWQPAYSRGSHRITTERVSRKPTSVPLRDRCSFGRANKSNIIDLRGWRTPSVSGEATAGSRKIRPTVHGGNHEPVPLISEGLKRRRKSRPRRNERLSTLRTGLYERPPPAGPVQAVRLHRSDEHIRSLFPATCWGLNRTHLCEEPTVESPAEPLLRGPRSEPALGGDTTDRSAAAASFLWPWSSMRGLP